jgi:N-dimethylarginine dimethylaminohydrolase
MWHQLVAVLDAVGAQITTLDPQPDLPDMVFTANHAVVLGQKVALANFKCPERKLERKRTFDFFSQYSDMCLPPFSFEGAGDCHLG